MSSGRSPHLGQAAHIAVDPSGRYAAVSANSAYEDGRGALTMITLADGSHRHVPIETGEPGLAFAADLVSMRGGQAIVDTFGR
jgi:hypothetical protein